METQQIYDKSFINSEQKCLVFVAGFKLIKCCRVEGRNEISVSVQRTGNHVGDIRKFKPTGQKPRNRDLICRIQHGRVKATSMHGMFGMNQTGNRERSIGSKSSAPMEARSSAEPP